MEKLTIENFIAAADDFEMSKYIILARLKKYNSMLHQNKLYPALSDLIELNKILFELNTQNEKISADLPNQKMTLNIIKPGLENKSITVNENDVSTVLKLIQWVTPKVDEAINEGKVIYEFVDENLSIDHVGIIPIYKNEGYFVITNPQKEKCQIYRFYLSSISQGENPFMTFKTDLVDSFTFTEPETIQPELLKLDLIKKFPELPNPVLYRIETEIDFPFIETILPVAKRKLVQHIAA
jgi:hypothetical protein